MSDTDRVVLLRPFHPRDYRDNEDGFVGVPGVLMEQRLDHATDGRWSVIDSEMRIGDDDLAVRLMIELPGLGCRPGFGGSRIGSGMDVSNALKSARTTAVRNAANGFGSGRELWPEAAGEHWLYWLGLVADADHQADNLRMAVKLLVATIDWVRSSDASAEHNRAWRGHYPRIHRALSEYDLDLSGLSTPPTAAQAAHADPPRQTREERPRDDQRDERSRESSGGGNYRWMREAQRASNCLGCGEKIARGAPQLYAPDEQGAYCPICTNDARTAPLPPPDDPDRQLDRAVAADRDPRDDSGPDPFDGADDYPDDEGN